MKRLSKRLSKRRSGRRSGQRGASQRPVREEKFLYSFLPNEEAWVSTKEGDFVPCVVLSQAGVLVTVRVEGKRVEQVDLRTRSVVPRNKGKSEADMTSLRHINDACILANLEQRSYEDEPYTFMGNILVSVNPLKEIAPPKGALGTRQAALHPHPFAIAEYSFQQMSFAADKTRKREEGTIVNQSIVASGESGAGKTEASKRVLQHLVQRCAQDKKLQTIDRRLLQSNEITESFGNAKTLRNNNSSRFGKLMSLHFSQLDTKRGETAAYRISAASVQTYLLERSRVSLHEEGERNYHVFYQLLSGVDKNRRSALFLDKVSRTGWRYLAALKSPTTESVSAGATEKEKLKDDATNFRKLEEAMKEMGMDAREIDQIFRLVAGIMHLGNIGFADEESAEGDIARPVEVESGYDAVECSAELLGIKPESLEELLLERKIQTREGEIAVHRNATAASFARDAVAKGLYSSLFDFVVQRINRSLDETGANGSSIDELPFIGVLDIFGFESFARNGFEQLLINFTNESLQSTFNRKVFEAELTLYRSEGLVVDETQMKVPPGNEATMTLLAGKLKHPGTLDQSREDKDAVLVDLDQQCRELQPTDAKMLKLFHQKFDAHPNFLRPHPKNMHEQFIIKHYAGTVTYTVGTFIEKNNDALPSEVNTLFSQSSSPILSEIFTELAKTQTNKRGKAVHRSIVKQFRSQILSLLDTLESTACSFIRCVKPNATMERHSSKTWFSRPYVAHQLRHLSIPQTALVLRSGLPTRISYGSLVETYMDVLPSKATKRFRKARTDDEAAQRAKNKGFVQSLFWAFEVDRASYKLGYTKVFFKAGEIAVLDKILQRAEVWRSNSGDAKVKKEQEQVAKRFAGYYIRLQWRRVFAKLRVVAFFLKSLDRRRKQQQASVKIQAVWRRYRAMREMRKKKYSAEMLREEADRKKREEEEERKRQEELEAEEENAYKNLERAMSLRKQATSVKTGRSNPAFGRESGDEEDDGNEEESSDSDESDFDESEETEEERHQRYVKEVEQRAMSATEKEIEKLEAEGEEVTEEKRAEIYDRFEEKYLREMARWEAMRKQNEAIRADIMNGLQMAKENAKSFGLRLLENIKWQFTPEGLNKAQSNFLYSSATVIDQLDALIGSTLQKNAPKVHGFFANIRSKIGRQLQVLNKQTEEMQQSPVYLRAVNEMQEKLDDAEKELPSSTSNILKRQQTMTGQTFKVNAAEIENPVASAKAQWQNLKELLRKGEIDPEEMRGMMQDMSRALDRRSSRTYSSQSDTFQGVSVFCSNCQTKGNTAEGLRCQNCQELLPVETEDQMRAFPRPSSDPDRWAGSLPFKDGMFFIRLEDETASFFNSSTFTEEIVFQFECAWERTSSGQPNGKDKRGNKGSKKLRKLHTRWVIQLTGPEVKAIHDQLVKHRKNIFKKVDPPAFPNAKQPVKKKGGKGRVGKIKRLFRGSRKPSVLATRTASIAESQMSSSMSQFSAKERMERIVGELQDWLAEVLEKANAANPEKSKDNPVFKYGFNEIFDVDMSIQRAEQALAR